MSRRQRTVLHIITGLEDGGAEAVLYRLVLGDTQNLHSVVSLTDIGKYGPLLRDRGHAVSCLEMPRGRISLRGLFRLLRVLHYSRPAIIQTWMYHADLFGGVVARLCGHRAIFWGIHHSTLEEGTVAGRTIVVARFCAWLSGMVPLRIICCAERGRNTHSDLGYRRDRIVVINYGYDLKTFKPDPQAALKLRKEWKVGEDDILLGTVARFHPQKDHSLLLQAMAMLRRRGTTFSLALIGRDMTPQNAELQRWILRHQLQDSVLLLGQRDDIPAVMSALDLHVLPSVAGEGFPNVVAEAMACETPCVVTDVGDAAEIVGGTGWVVQPGSVAALADGLNQALAALADRCEWVDRCKSARSRVETLYGIDRMLARYGEVWTEADA